MDVLTRFRQSEVEEAVKKLDSEQVDILMKYIYRGFAEPTENSCGILLVWHQHVSYMRVCVHIGTFCVHVDIRTCFYI